MKTLIIRVFILAVFLTFSILDYNSFLHASDESITTQKVTLKVDGMTCSMCPLTIKTALKKLDGVIDADGSCKDKETKVMYKDSKVTIDLMIKAIENAGNYKAAYLDE